MLGDNAPGWMAITSPGYYRTSNPEAGRCGKALHDAQRWMTYLIRSPHGETIECKTLDQVAKRVGSQRSKLATYIKGRDIYITRSGWTIVMKSLSTPAKSGG